jgi:hypothetical protein
MSSGLCGKESIELGVDETICKSFQPDVNIRDFESVQTDSRLQIHAKSKRRPEYTVCGIKLYPVTSLRKQRTETESFQKYQNSGKACKTCQIRIRQMSSEKKKWS